MLGLCGETDDLAEALARDENLHRLRTEILTKPTLLTDAAEKLFPKLEKEKASTSLQSMLELVANSGEDNQSFYPLACITLCGRKRVCTFACEAIVRDAMQAAPRFFVSRQNRQTSRREETSDCPEGHCPDCRESEQKSLLVETVSCRKCGYLYGALQDLGPRRAQNPGNLSDEIGPSFDSFSTELGWAADSFWSYFSVDNDLPFPKTNSMDEEDVDSAKLLESPKEIEWCACCGKKKAFFGDYCAFPVAANVFVYFVQLGGQSGFHLLQTANPGEALVHVGRLCHASQSSLAPPRCQANTKQKKPPRNQSRRLYLST